jgi:hypothetical protein
MYRSVPARCLAGRWSCFLNPELGVRYPRLECGRTPGKKLPLHDQKCPMVLRIPSSTYDCSELIQRVVIRNGRCEAPMTCRESRAGRLLCSAVLVM